MDEEEFIKLQKHSMKKVKKAASGNGNGNGSRGPENCLNME
jgi:hypothetical protein